MASRELKVEIVGDSRSLERALGKATSSSSKFGTAFGKIGKAAAIGLGAVAVGAAVAGKKMLDMASDAAEVDSKLDVVFGKALPALTKNLDDFSEATGASRYELRQQAADVGALVEPLTANKKAAANMSESVVKLATDLGSFNNVPVADALIAIRAGLVGEAEPLRRFGVLLNAAAVETEGVRLGLAKTGKELTEQDKVQARYSLVMKQTSLAQGDATRTADSMANQMKALRNNVTDMATSLGQLLIPYALAAAKAFNDHWPTIETVIRAVVVGIVAGIGGIVTAVNYLRGQWEIHRESAIKTWNAVRTAVLQFIDWFKTNVVPAIQNVVSAARALWQHFGGEITAIGARLVASVKQTFLNMVAPIRIILALLKGDWSEAWNIMKQVVTGTLGTMLGNMKAALGGIVSAAVDIGKGIVKGLVSGLAGLAGAVSGAISAAAGAAYTAAYNVGTRIVSGVWDGFKSMIGGIKDKISGAIGGIISGIDVPGFSPPEAAAAKAIGKPIADGVLRGFLEGTAQLPQKMGDKLRASIEAGAAAVHAQQSRLSMAFQQLGTDAMTAFGAATDAGLDKIQKNLDAKLKKIGDQLSAAMKKIDVAQAAKTPAEKALEQLDRSEQLRSMADAAEQARQALEKAMSGEGFEPAKDETPEQAAERQKRQAEAVFAATEQVRQAQLALQRDALAQQALAERTAADKRAEDARIKAEKAAAAETLRLQKQAGNQALQYQAQRDLQQRHLQKMLDNLEAKLLQGDVKWSQAHKRVMLAFKDEFGPDLSTAGRNLGTAFANGLRESITGVGSAAEDLAKAIAKYLKLKSPAEAGPLSDLDRWWTELAPMLASQIDPAPITAAASGIGKALEEGLGAGTSEEGLGGVTTAIVALKDNMAALKAEGIQHFKLLGEGLALYVPPAVAILQTLLDKLNSIREMYLGIAGAADKAGDVTGIDLSALIGLQHGGVVTKPTLALIGEAGPEAVVPLGKSYGAMPGGGLVINNYISGSVTSERDLVTSIRNAIVAEGRRSGGGLMGGYA